jgi:hypothetical protein
MAGLILACVVAALLIYRAIRPALRALGVI